MKCLTVADFYMIAQLQIPVCYAGHSHTNSMKLASVSQCSTVSEHIEGSFDFSTIIKTAGDPWENLRHIVKDICEVLRMRLLAHHSKPVIIQSIILIK